MESERFVSVQFAQRLRLHGPGSLGTDSVTAGSDGVAGIAKVGDSYVLAMDDGRRIHGAWANVVAAQVSVHAALSGSPSVLAQSEDADEPAIVTHRKRKRGRR